MTRGEAEAALSHQIKTVAEFRTIVSVAQAELDATPRGKRRQHRTQLGIRIDRYTRGIAYREREIALLEEMLAQEPVT